ncbi:MAG TPA: ABC transporter substrate-binding protein [Thermoleophilaceae bacterium]
MKRRLIVAVAALIAAASLAAGCGGSGSSGGSTGSTASSTGPTGHVNIVIWHGYADAEAKAIKTLTAEFNATHKNVTVTEHYNGNSDYALQKVLTAIAGGKPPDIAYLYGSWMANIAKSPKTVDLNDFIKTDKSFDWNDFWPAEREAATVNGKVVGLPALVDNLALVYNKKLFDKAGLAYPTANWTWTDFQNAALKLTDPAKKQFGWAYVADGSEDTVWRYWALLWQAGGAILNGDGTKSAFNSPAGVKAMSLIDGLARKQAIYLDNGNQNYLGLFNSGHIGMLYTGPWDLTQLTAKLGVQILPADQNHQTISGPDNWVMFDNGDARKQGAWEFLKWFTSPEISLQWSLLTGDLPIRAGSTKLPGYQQFLKKYPGIGVWVDNLKNATQVRPVTPVYPKISEAMGQAVVSVLLGKAQPQKALSDAAQQVDSILSVPG